MSTRAPKPRPTLVHLRSLEERLVAAERRNAGLSRAVLSLLRRIFRRCQGKPVNQLSRQMTPEEAVELHARMAAHGVAVDDDETRGGTPRRERAAR